MQKGLSLIFVRTGPHISEDHFDTAKQYIYVFGREGEHKFGYLENSILVKPVKNRFIELLLVNLQEILMIAGNKGHFLL